MSCSSCTNHKILLKIRDLYAELFKHDGFGQMTIEVRILKRGQKEVIIHCGKQYRYVVDYPSECDCLVVSKDKKNKLVKCIND